MSERQLRAVPHPADDGDVEHQSAAQARSKRIDALSLVHPTVPRAIVDRPRPPEAQKAEEQLKRWRQNDTRTRLDVLRRFMKRFGG